MTVDEVINKFTEEYGCVPLNNDELIDTASIVASKGIVLMNVRDHSRPIEVVIVKQEGNFFNYKKMHDLSRNLERMPYSVWSQTMHYFERKNTKRWY